MLTLKDKVTGLFPNHKKKCGNRIFTITTMRHRP